MAINTNTSAKDNALDNPTVVFRSAEIHLCSIMQKSHSDKIIINQIATITIYELFEYTIH
jgi:hypothetical protein